MTLPSRLRNRDGKRESLDEIAGSLNVNGNQNIAKLQMSIENEPQLNGEDSTGRHGLPSESKDSRIRSHNGQTEANGMDKKGVSDMDMDFFPPEAPTLVRGPRIDKKTHIFGQVESFRAENEWRDQEDDDFDGQERAKRRAAGLPVVHK